MRTKHNKTRSYPIDSLMRYAKMLKCNDIFTKIDRQSGLHAIIAIHNSDLGPAIGGCRFYPYRSTGTALKDVLRLSYMMTLKAAISDLAHGGAKAVILAPQHVQDRTLLFKHFGDFVHELNGRYITACDVGTSTDDMEIIAQRTPYVIGATKKHDFHSDPSPYTAQGVYYGIQAAVNYKLKRPSLDGIRIAVQGAGNVAYHLTKLLTEAGAKVIICDPKAKAIDKFTSEFKVDHVSTEAIYDVNCDVFCPCAMGAVINNDTIGRISAPIIAGSANNQLAHRKHANSLKQKGVLYVPDFVINSGGLINAAMIYDFQDPSMADSKIAALTDTVTGLFIEADRTHQSTLTIAENIARKKLAIARSQKDQLIESVLAN